MVARIYDSTVFDLAKRDDQSLGKVKSNMHNNFAIFRIICLLLFERAMCDEVLISADATIQSKPFRSCPWEKSIVVTNQGDNIRQFDPFAFLSQEEIQTVLSPSYMARVQASGSEFSSSVYLNEPGDAKHPLLRRLVEQVTDCVDRDLSYAETFAMTLYKPGQKYAWHYDSYGSDKATLRLATFLLYLNDVKDGGETIFAYVSPIHPPRSSSQRLESQLSSSPKHSHLHGAPDLIQSCLSDSVPERLKIKPVAGRALLFHNLNVTTLTPNPLSLHASCPVGPQQHKWILQLWIRFLPIGSHSASSSTGGGTVFWNRTL